MQTPNPSSIPRPRFFIPPRLALAAFALGATLACGHLPALRAAEGGASVQVAEDNDTYRLFYDKLTEGGSWLQTDDYGYVFQPDAARDKAWRPYTDGYWAQTDSGWAWVSNEDFGWACYHYGRWANLVDTGWVWVPGPDWSPGYVSWRVSKDHKRIGWAPLPPEARVTADEPVESWVDTAYDIGPEAYCFIDTEHFGDTSYRTHLIPFDQNVTIITETENVTRINYRTVDNRAVVFNGGPDVTVIREVTGRPVRELRLETRPENVEFFVRGDRRRITEVNGDRLVVAVAAPDVIRSTSIRVSAPARIERRLTAVTVDRGYRGLRDPQQIERVRATLRSQGPPPPPLVQQRAAAALRRDGVGRPGEPRPGGPRDAERGGPVPGAPGAPVPPPSPGREREDRPLPANRAEPAPGNPRPGAPETERERERERRRGQEPGAPNPEGAPGARNREDRGKRDEDRPDAPPAPGRDKEDRPERPDKPGDRPGKPNPEDRADRPNKPNPEDRAERPDRPGDRGDEKLARPPGGKEDEEKAPAPKRQEGPARNEKPDAEPRRSEERANRPENPPKPADEPARQREGGREERAEERKPEAPKPAERERPDRKPAPEPPGGKPGKEDPKP